MKIVRRRKNPNEDPVEAACPRTSQSAPIVSVPSFLRFFPVHTTPTCKSCQCLGTAGATPSSHHRHQANQYGGMQKLLPELKEGELALETMGHWSRVN